MRWAMLLIGLLLTVSACTRSSSTTGNSQPASPVLSGTHVATYAAVQNACALATESEVGTIIQVSVKAHASTAHNLATCTYAVSSQEFVQTNVTIEPSIGAAQNDFTDQQEGVAAQTVSGVGEAAFFDGSETLTVLQRNAITTIIVHVARVQQKLHAGEQIAHLIVQRLA